MSFPLIFRVRDARRAFTLIELLTVIAIIGILAAITFGVVKGVQERAAVQQARTELAVISQALEAYKRLYGDYPQTASGAANSATATSASATDRPGILFNALVGKRGPLAVENKINGKALIELGKFTVQSTTAADLPDNTAETKPNALVDPWGRRYLYSYKAGVWNNPSFILYSVGPDGLDTPPVNGIMDAAGTNNSDNLYANR